MVPLSYDLEREQAELYGLILSSAGIGNRIIPVDDGFRILVPYAMEDNAMEAIHRYHMENPVVSEERTEESLPLLTVEYTSGLYIALLLLVVHLAVTTSSAPQDYTDVFGADSIRILRGEIYRCVTALLLHADAVHLAGNMVGIVLFGGAVSAVGGTGVGWLAILSCGILGNYLNAIAYDARHLSIGASTSIFGAVGLLSAFQAVKAKRTGKGWKQVGLALGGGFGLLAFLGTSARSDLGAHLFGFVVGGVMGAIYSRWFYSEKLSAVQWGSGSVAAALVVGAWIWGSMG
jgi:membrane associated rhomboid family serine protease